MAGLLAQCHLLFRENSGLDLSGPAFSLLERHSYNTAGPSLRFSPRLQISIWTCFFVTSVENLPSGRRYLVGNIRLWERCINLYVASANHFRVSRPIYDLNLSREY